MIGSVASASMTLRGSGMGIHTCRRPTSTASRLPALRIPACHICTIPPVVTALRHPRHKLIPTLCITTTTTALTTIMLYTAITRSKDHNILRRPCHTLEERRPSSIVRDQPGNMNALFLYKDLCMPGSDKVIQQSSSRFLRIKEKHRGTGQARTSTSRNTIRTWLIIAIENATHLTERDPKETRARWSLADALLGLRSLLSTTAATVPWLCPLSWRLVIRCNRRLLECHPRT